MAERQTGRNSDQFNLRLPEGMRERISEEARMSGRSMNSEIVHRLANSLDNPNFKDMTLGLGEELDFALMSSAGMHGRSLTEEMIYRLEQSLLHQPTLIGKLEEEAWQARRKVDELMNLFIQLTPEERRLLEERAEIAAIARKAKISSKDIGKFVKLNPIGNRGRISLSVPKSDYSPIFPEETTAKTAKFIIEEFRRSDE